MTRFTVNHAHCTVAVNLNLGPLNRSSAYAAMQTM